MENQAACRQNLGCRKTHFVAIYKSKEKFNAKREARTGGLVSNNPSHVLPNISSTMSTVNHHSQLEYTNSLEGALETATEHAAAITLDNTTILQQL